MLPTFEPESDSFCAKPDGKTGALLFADRTYSFNLPLFAEDQFYLTQRFSLLAGFQAVYVNRVFRDGYRSATRGRRQILETDGSFSSAEVPAPGEAEEAGAASLTATLGGMGLAHFAFGRAGGLPRKRTSDHGSSASERRPNYTGFYHDRCGGNEAKPQQKTPVQVVRAACRLLCLWTMRIHHILPIALLGLCLFVTAPGAHAAQMTENSFTVPIGQYFVLDQHGGPAVKMRVSSVDVGFVAMDYKDEFGRGWNVRPEKHNSVSGREANLTLLYRHASTGFEVYFLNATATPGGQAMIITRKYQ